MTYLISIIAQVLKINMKFNDFVERLAPNLLDLLFIDLMSHFSQVKQMHSQLRYCVFKSQEER